MTETDLRLMYQSDTGLCPPTINEIEGKGAFNNSALQELFKYVEWVEEKLLTKINEV